MFTVLIELGTKPKTGINIRILPRALVMANNEMLMFTIPSLLNECRSRKMIGPVDQCSNERFNILVAFTVVKFVVMV